jgi:hypothetical protein
LEFRGVIVIRVKLDIWVIGKVALKSRGRRGKVMGLLDFLALVCVWVYFYFIVEGAFVRDCRGLGFCTVGTVV